MGVANRWAQAALAAGGLAVLLQGCAPKPAAPAQEATVLPPHFGPPPAAACTVPTLATVPAGGTQAVSMTVGNDGGYCAVALVTPGGTPYDAGLEPRTPAHGHALIMHYNGKTSIEYTPAPGFAGPDSFTARLIVKDQPGYTTLNVAVTVTK